MADPHPPHLPEQPDTPEAWAGHAAGSGLPGLPDQHGAFETPYNPVQKPPGLTDWLRRLIGPALAVLFLGWKFFKIAFIAIKGVKFFSTAITMVISIWAYTLFWGLPFAIGFVVLMLVHEMGHVLQLRREGIPATAPMFIPFLGAVVGMKELPQNAWSEAKVALAGPILGSFGALVVYGVALQYDSLLLQAIAYTGFFLNLFNLLPVTPLDGGRAMAAVSPALWFVGLAGIVVLALWWRNPILFLIVIMALFDVRHRWRDRHDMQAYYRAVTPKQRTQVIVVYLALAFALVVLMDVSLVDPDLLDRG